MLLAALVVAWQVAMVPVQANNACQQACAQSYDLCIADNASQRQLCYTQAEGSYTFCMLSASASAYQCIENAYWECVCMGGCTSSLVQQIQQRCGEDYADATQECASDYSSETASCNIAEQTANETCGNAYNACYNNCPPD